jgi:transcriptional regulator with XRE-family HTH domain
MPAKQPDKKSNRRYYFREWRQMAGLSLADLSNILGITEGQISKIETDERDFTGDFLDDLATVLDCKPWELLMGPPANFVDNTGLLSTREKLILQRRLTRRSKEMRKLRRRDRHSNGHGNGSGNSDRQDHDGE